MANESARNRLFHRTTPPGSATVSVWDKLPKQDLLPLSRWQRIREWWRGR